MTRERMAMYLIVVSHMRCEREVLITFKLKGEKKETKKRKELVEKIKAISKECEKYKIKSYKFDDGDVSYTILLDEWTDYYEIKRLKNVLQNYGIAYKIKEFS